MMLRGQHKPRGAGALLTTGWKTLPGTRGRAPGRVPVPSRLAIRWRHHSSARQEQLFPLSFKDGDLFSAGQDFRVAGEEVQITQLPTESKKSAEVGLKHRPHIGLHGMGTELISKSSLRCQSG